MRLLLMLCCVAGAVGCRGDGVSGQDVQALQKQVDALQQEMADLRKELDAKPAPPSAPPSSTDGTLPGSVAAEIRLRVTTEPGGARVFIEGTAHEVPVDLIRARSDSPVRLRIERTGYRTVVQAVVLDRDRELDYRLTPGRGLIQRPTDR